jgi:hypothetical protein
MKNLFFEMSSIDLKNRCGIYLININEHNYVGSSKSLYARLYEHRSDLKAVRHSNSFMQKAYTKYSADKTFYKILEYCSESERIEKEKHWINHVKADMNMQDPVTKQLSQISKDKISASLKDAYATGRKTRPTSEPIEVYDIYGNFKTEYLSAADAAKDLNIKTHTIQIAASKYYEGRTCGLLRFRYKYSKVKPKIFNIVGQNKFTSKFSYTLTEPDGTVKDINAGIKHLNKAILEQILKGNFEFVIKANPKSPR